MVEKDTVYDVICVLIGLAAAFFVFQGFHPEDFMKRDLTPVSASEAEADKLGKLIGREAGDDIRKLTGKEDFETLFASEYVTMVPKGIVNTGVCTLKNWESPYVRRAGSRKAGAGKLKDKVMKSGWDVLDEYLDYYLLECPDGTYILAQMPDRVVGAIEKGESVTLPLGRVVPLVHGADTYLSEVCEEYDASMKGALYMFDDGWYKTRSFSIFIIRFAVAAAVCLAVGVCLIMVGGKLFGKKKEIERK